MRFATLAANSHNSQPWLFLPSANDNIIIAPDFTRRCPAVDPDDHHLFASLGCALENLSHAAAALGLRAAPRLEGDRISVEFEREPPTRSALFEAIVRRGSTRAMYDGKSVANDRLRIA